MLSAEEASAVLLPRLARRGVGRAAGGGPLERWLFLAERSDGFLVDENRSNRSLVWGYHCFRGERWCSFANSDHRRYLLNAYRVLLTRARQGPPSHGFGAVINLSLVEMRAWPPPSRPSPVAARPAARQRRPVSVGGSSGQTKGTMCRPWLRDYGALGLFGERAGRFEYGPGVLTHIQSRRVTPQSSRGSVKKSGGQSCSLALTASRNFCSRAGVAA